MQRTPGDFHMHTYYCDGENTPREMVEAALARGLRAVGICGHGYVSFDEGTLSPEGTQYFIKEVRELAREYEDRIDIFLGLENDSAQVQPLFGFDYSIGSVHFVSHCGSFYCVDATKERFETAIQEGFAGDALSLAQAYYQEVVCNVSATRPDIVGHFDLVTKFNRENAYFDEENHAYRAAALGALEAVVRFGSVVEINTGAMAKGYLQRPYPAPFLLERLKELRAPILLSSDAHNKEHICFAFEQTREMLKNMGFRERVELTHKGFTTVAM